ncbi:uncharacterized protein si:dkey-225f5.4 [Oryzias melastigma]|uniref:Uncharacterized LOC112139418 n=1 Tax=Oryzias melastigma TaxID=30732 RepID=A0A3B3DVT3_ORYME|nr:uncharacterized protein si:dkey-225f5.4 [Oryzias melastigma]XP_024117980.1 uncharacterized protein si:dkey-225f5.4 [Oryzias melastigma]
MAARAVLRRCDPALLEPAGDPDRDRDAERMLLSLSDSRRVQKVLWRQLFVLDSMMTSLESLESAQQLQMEPRPPQTEGGAKASWKALKAGGVAAVEQTEELLTALQDRLQQIYHRRHALSQLLQRLHTQVQHQDQLQAELLAAQNALRSCDQHVTRLRAESEAVLSRLLDWQQLRDSLQLLGTAVQEVTQVNLLSFNQSELCVEFRPRPPSTMSAQQLEPVGLTVTWSSEGFSLQVDESMAGLVGSCVTGRRAELSAALLDVLQSYVGQVELLSEIQSLRSSFAIDWRPAQRLLLYLKTASLVCHLHVEEGYPGGGRARLLSVQRDGQPVDANSLQPHREDPSLTEWLVLLCSSPAL